MRLGLQQRCLTLEKSIRSKFLGFFCVTELLGSDSVVDLEKVQLCVSLYTNIQFSAFFFSIANHSFFLRKIIRGEELWNYFSRRWHFKHFWNLLCITTTPSKLTFPRLIKKNLCSNCDGNYVELCAGLEPVWTKFYMVCRRAKNVFINSHVQTLRFFRLIKVREKYLRLVFCKKIQFSARSDVCFCQWHFRNPTFLNWISRPCPECLNCWDLNMCTWFQ